MIIHTGRREFLRSLLACSLAAGVSSFKKAGPTSRLAFTTLGCPDWSYGQIVEFAGSHGYDGIEFRGLKREFDLTKTETFGSPENINAALQRAKDNNVKIISLGSSAVLHHSDVQSRTKNIDEAKRFIDLAQKLECPYVRVFADKFIDGKEKTSALIAEGMRTLAEYGESAGIVILLSTHGDVVTGDSVCGIMNNVPNRNAGIGWDIVNTWYKDRQPPTSVYAKIRKYIRLVHVKDMSFREGKEKNVLLGRGEVPVFEGINALLNDGYDGYFSYVSEKHWFPEMEEPEVAFPEYIRVMKEYLRNRS